MMMGKWGRLWSVLAAISCGATAAAAADSPPGTDAHHQQQDCAITFDDGPGPHTGLLLDELAKVGAKATFFVLGENVSRHPDLIKRLISEGHEVENHSWDHPDMRKLSPEQRQREIGDTMALLKSLGAEPHYFRPPYGAYDPALVEQVRKDGLSLVLWSHDSMDWRYHTVTDMEEHALPSGTAVHGIFLFHDIHDSTIAAIPSILDDLAKRGCHFVTIAQWEEHIAQAPAQQPTAPIAPISSPHPVEQPPAHRDVLERLGDWLK